MQPSIKKLSELEKEQILQESYEPSCVIPIAINNIMN